ncbi:calpain-9-like isoform X2 [Brevipalpus obovatus]|uniref:calpain-9-like isoform X2 n=1 Tax=Brevipalpus obovatus TaxID=246614 RepID=UPI003D9FAE88
MALDNESTLQIGSYHPHYFNRNGALNRPQYRNRPHYRHHGIPSSSNNNGNSNNNNPTTINQHQTHNSPRLKVSPPLTSTSASPPGLGETSNGGIRSTVSHQHNQHHQPSPPVPPPPPPVASSNHQPPPVATHPSHDPESGTRLTNGHHHSHPHHLNHHPPPSSSHHVRVPNGHYNGPRSDHQHNHQHQHSHHHVQSEPSPSSGTNSQQSSQVTYDYLRRLCRDRGILFEDISFSAQARSLFGKKEVPSSSSSCNFLTKILSSIVWMRPHEICSRPKFINDSPSRFDVEQGEAIIALSACAKPTRSSNGGSNGANTGSSAIITSPSSSHHHNHNDISFTKTTCSSLLSAISCLTLTPNLLDRVVPSDQSFLSGQYCGIFRFRFWHFGEWAEVIIDDKLPTYKGRLLFLRSVDPTEFWAALLEKAYAKLYGNYEYYLTHCFTAQTLQDLTGGIAQSFTIPHHDSHIIYQMISSAVPRSTLLSACISGVPQSESISPSSVLSHSAYAFSSSSSSALSTAMIKLQPCRLRNGLITRQSYSITGLARVRTSARALGLHQPPMFTASFHPNHLSSAMAAAAAAHSANGGHGAAAAVAGTNSGTIEVVLIRLRNAWGKGEWNGPWSERSWEWDTLTEQDKLELAARCREDGEFWMSFDDFLRYFTHLDLVHIGPDDWMNETSLHHKRPWRAVLARRRWRYGFNSGGSPDHRETFATNPQFHIHIARNGLNKCHVVVSVTQFYTTNPVAINSPPLLANVMDNHQSNGGSRSSGSGGAGGLGGLSGPGGCVGGNGNSSRDDRQSAAHQHHLHHIGFCVYEVPPGMKRLTRAFVTAHRPLDVTAFTATRETVTFFTLPPGDFIIVPSTDKPHCETKFLLRILTDEPSTIWEVNDDNSLCADISIPRLIENTSQNGQSLYARLVSKLPPEIDALILFKVLKAYYKPLNILYEKPSMDLCRCLIMLKDNTITGKLVVRESLAPLLNMLHFWRTIFIKYQSDNKVNKVSSYNFRLVLWEAGISVSNKVLECLIIRYSNNSARLTLESYLLSLVKLYLAHDRYRTIEKKSKNQNLTLEEMILLTTYS